MLAVHFGSGNIGRGFIGNLLHKAGYTVCFVDVNLEIIRQINEEKKYKVAIADTEGTIEEITNIYALHSITQLDQVLAAILDADLITTSVGAENLSKIAPTLKKGLIQRIEKKQPPIDIIANENVINASFLLHCAIKEICAEEEILQIGRYAGFVNSAIDRQALNKNVDGQEIAFVEEYFEWIINKAEIKNTAIHPIAGATYVENMQPYIERKLFCVNAGHAAAAYIGFLMNKNTVQEALAVPEIYNFIKAAMKESAAYLIKQYDFSSSEMDAYILKTLKRHSNPSLQDSVLRVGRAPVRKLQYHERLVSPARILYALGLPVAHFTNIIASVFFFRNIQDDEAVLLQNYIKENGIVRAIKHFTKIEDPGLIQAILKDYQAISETEGSSIFQGK